MSTSRSLLTTIDEACDYPKFTDSETKLRVEAVTSDKTAEILRFLSARPIHTVMMNGLIRDNGLISPLNRGTFYACRNQAQRLEGVALIGHLTLLETQTERARKALALQAQQNKHKHLIVGEESRIDRFLQYYSAGGQKMRHSQREMLLELKSPVISAPTSNYDIRLATLEDLELIVPVQAELAEENSKVNPLVVDPKGFRERCARRIKKGRTWVITEGSELIFKTEVMVDTREVIYLEGVYVSPERRGKGFGSTYLSKLCNQLLQNTESICVLVNESNESARAFYPKVGFSFNCWYEHVFLQSI
jgi:predicted GNAT family acetyltransferase